MEHFFNTCKPGEVLGNNGQCVFPAPTPIVSGEPACAGGQIIDGQCRMPIVGGEPVCRPGEFAYQGICVLPTPPCKPGEIVYQGRCLAPLPTPPGLTCKAVQIAIEPACVQAQGCTPDPAVGIALLFTLLVQCL